MLRSMSAANSSNEDLDWLRTVPLFAGLDFLWLRMLAFIAADTRYLAGDLLALRGEAVERIFILRDGLVRLSADHTAGPGVMIGIDGLFAPRLWAGDVIADIPVRASVIERDRFCELLDRFPEVALALRAGRRQELLHDVRRLNDAAEQFKKIAT